MPIYMMKLIRKQLLGAALVITINGFAQGVTFFNAGGAFTIGTQSNRTASITLFDIDLDGDLDALVANGRHWAEQNYIYYNDGKGGFKSAQPIGKYLDASYAIKSPEFNNDGFLDIITGNLGTKNNIYFGNKDLNFKQVYDFKPKHMTSSIKVVDLNQDGNLDLVEGNFEEQNFVYLGQENGGFVEIAL